MTLRRVTPALAIVLLAWVCPLQAADETAVRDAIRTAEERFARAHIKGDVPAMMEVYADDAVIFPPGEGAVSGKRAVAQWMTRMQATSPRMAREQFETASLDVCEDFAVETGNIAMQFETPGTVPATMRAPYVTEWKRQADGSWKIQKDIWNHPGSGAPVAAAPVSPEASPAPVPPAAPAPPAAAPAPAPAPAPAAASPLPPPMVAPPSDFIPIPDARPLSDGFVRTIGDQLKTRAGKIRSLEASHADEQTRLAAIRRADHELQTLIRDVGWIDVGRFGVTTACNAAFIVERSGDSALIKSAVPLMKDLQSNDESVACYTAARQAYDRLPR
jgi:ketosteroid isomerase-like protein